MKNRFKKETKVIVYGPSESDGRFYKNVPAKVIECDPYYKDYLVRFKDGTEDWILPKYIRRPYSIRKKRS